MLKQTHISLGSVVHKVSTSRGWVEPMKVRLPFVQSAFYVIISKRRPALIWNIIDVIKQRTRSVETKGKTVEKKLNKDDNQIPL